MSILLPRADRKRLVLLGRIESTEEHERSVGRPKLPDPILNEVHNQRLALRNELARIEPLVGARREEVTERDRITLIAENHARAFRSGVLWRVRMYEYTDAYPRYFGIGDTLPSYIAPHDVVDLINVYIRGEDAAVAAGYPPMLNPTRAEIRTQRNLLERELGDVDAADRALDEVQHSLVPLREAIDRIIRLVSSQLDLSLFDLPEDDVRHIKRRYGFIFEEDEATDAGADSSATGEEDAGMSDDESTPTA